MTRHYHFQILKALFILLFLFLVFWTGVRKTGVMTRNPYPVKDYQILNLPVDGPSKLCEIQFKDEEVQVYPLTPIWVNGIRTESLISLTFGDILSFREPSGDSELSQFTFEHFPHKALYEPIHHTDFEDYNFQRNEYSRSELFIGGPAGDPKKAKENKQKNYFLNTVLAFSEAEREAILGPENENYAGYLLAFRPKDGKKFEPQFDIHTPLEIASPFLGKMSLVRQGRTIPIPDTFIEFKTGDLIDFNGLVQVRFRLSQNIMPSFDYQRTNSSKVAVANVRDFVEIHFDRVTHKLNQEAAFQEESDEKPKEWLNFFERIGSKEEQKAESIENLIQMVLRDTQTQKTYPLSMVKTNLLITEKALMGSYKGEIIPSRISHTKKVGVYEAYLVTPLVHWENGFLKAMDLDELKTWIKKDEASFKDIQNSWNNFSSMTRIPQVSYSDLKKIKKKLKRAQGTRDWKNFLKEINRFNQTLHPRGLAFAIEFKSQADRSAVISDSSWKVTQDPREDESWISPGNNGPNPTLHGNQGDLISFPIQSQPWDPNQEDRPEDPSFFRKKITLDHPDQILDMKLCAYNSYDLIVNRKEVHQGTFEDRIVNLWPIINSKLNLKESGIIELELVIVVHPQKQGMPFFHEPFLQVQGTIGDVPFTTDITWDVSVHRPSKWPNRSKNAPHWRSAASLQKNSRKIWYPEESHAFKEHKYQRYFRMPLETDASAVLTLEQVSADGAIRCYIEDDNSSRPIQPGVSANIDRHSKYLLVEVSGSFTPKLDRFDPFFSLIIKDSTLREFKTTNPFLSSYQSQRGLFLDGDGYSLPRLVCVEGPLKGMETAIRPEGLTFFESTLVVKSNSGTKFKLDLNAPTRSANDYVRVFGKRVRLHRLGKGLFLDSIYILKKKCSFLIPASMSLADNQTRVEVQNDPNGRLVHISFFGLEQEPVALGPGDPSVKIGDNYFIFRPEGDGVLARTQNVNGRHKRVHFLRDASNTTGIYTNRATTGLEQVFNDLLSPSGDPSARPEPFDVQLTLDDDLQNLVTVEIEREIFDRKKSDIRKNHGSKALNKHVKEKKFYEAAFILSNSAGEILAASSWPFLESDDDRNLQIAINTHDNLYNRSQFINRNWQQSYPPGSSFKLVTTLVLLEEALGKDSHLSKSEKRRLAGYLRKFPVPSTYQHNLYNAPLGNTGKRLKFYFGNFQLSNGVIEACPPGTPLNRAFQISFNTYFGYLPILLSRSAMESSLSMDHEIAFRRYGYANPEARYHDFPYLYTIDKLGINRNRDLMQSDQVSQEVRSLLFSGIQRNMISDRVGADHLTVIPSNYPMKGLKPWEISRSAIGQFEVHMTPYQQLINLSVVQTGGDLVIPRLIKSIRQNDKVFFEMQMPSRIEGVFDGKALNRRSPLNLKSMMNDVINGRHGTAKNAFPYYAHKGNVHGKTGTAESADKLDHAWFIGFYEHEASGETYYFACVFPDSGIGGAISGVVARRVLERLDEYLALRDVIGK